jgi:tRNA(Ile)-lysidine synthase
MNFDLDFFLDKIKKNNEIQYFIKEKKKLLLAVSGGVDSVVLFDIFYFLKINFSVAHCNFNLRGEESNQDQKFVENLSKKYDIEFFTKNFFLEKISRKSTQMIAREMRYNWFFELLNEKNFSKLVTAHHLNDSIETFFLNFFRGSGIDGLLNFFNQKNSLIFRPLVKISKDELYKYSEEKKLEYRTDSSNKKNDYKRNFFRNNIYPLIKEMNQSFEDTFLSNINRISEINSVWKNHLEDFQKKIVKKFSDKIEIDVKEILEKKNAYVLYEILSPYRFSFLQVKDFLEKVTQSGKKIFSKDYIAELNDHKLILYKKNLNKSKKIIFLKDSNFEKKIIEVENNKFNVKKIKENFFLKKTNKIAQLDLDKITFPIVYRKHENGEKFIPLGMKNKKKISDFLIDQKISSKDKENIRILESNNEIIWIIGKRISDKFKVSEFSKNILEIEFAEKNFLN